MKTAKYRPCFTSEQISHIIVLCKKELSDSSLSVISVLAPFKAKIENSCIAPAYSLRKKESLVNSLGIENDGGYSCLTPDERRAHAFEKWSQDPNACNVGELELVRDYRFFNDLLSPGELEQYDAATNAILARNGLSL